MAKREWVEKASRELLALQSPEGSWAYRLGASTATEPTSMAGLALLAGREPDGGRVASASSWLAKVQRPDGSLGVSATVLEPGWTTPHALLLWQAAKLRPDCARRAATWLLGQKGRALPRADDPGRIAGHDTTLIGWPWVSDTHSWLEPTALSVLALGRAGYGDHPRVVEGLKLVRDREVESGGWNYGNKAVFGRVLRAQPGPTGLALLTLAGIDSRSVGIDRAIDYLKKTLPDVRASASLGWGILGLRAWGAVPEAAEEWLAEAHAAVTGRPDAAPRLAMLLLAAHDHSPSLFGRSAPIDSAASSVAGNPR